MKNRLKALVTILAAGLTASVQAGVSYSFISGPASAWPTTPTINFGNPPDAAAETANPNGVLSETFLAPTGNNYLSAFYLYGNGGASTLDLHLFDLGVSAPGSAYSPGTDLFSGISVSYGGNGSRATQQFTFTGVDQVTLTAGHYYAIEIYNQSGSANPFFWGRLGGAASVYADGHMYTATGGGTRSFVSGLDRDAVGAIYLSAVPEPSSFALAGLGLAALLAFRRRSL